LVDFRIVVRVGDGLPPNVETRINWSGGWFFADEIISYYG